MKGERGSLSTLTLTVPERFDLACWTNGFPNLFSNCLDTYKVSVKESHRVEEEKERGEFTHTHLKQFLYVG